MGRHKTLAFPVDPPRPSWRGVSILCGGVIRLRQGKDTAALRYRLLNGIPARMDQMGPAGNRTRSFCQLMYNTGVVNDYILARIALMNHCIVRNRAASSLLVHLTSSFVQALVH